MKNIAIILLLGLCLFAQDVFGQVPQGFNYQAVARNASDEIIKDEFVSVRFWILEDNQNGTPIYREVHQSVYTGVHGIMTLVIGQGTPETGTFSNIDWGSKSHFVRIDLDVNNGNNFDQMGTSQLLTVPYAMFAHKSGDGGSGGNDDWGTQTVQHNSTLIGDGTNSSPLSVNVDQVNTDNQVLSINGNQLSLTNGGTVSIPTGGTDADADPLNEIQNLSHNTFGNDVTVEISRGGSPTTFSIADSDSDPMGEIQELSISGNMITLSKNGGTISVPTGGTDADADPLNEIQNLSHNTSGNDVTVEISRGGSPTTFSVADSDSDPIGEIQELSISGNMITLSKNGGTISIPTGGTDADADPMNEIQELVLRGPDTIALSRSDSVIVLADNDPLNEFQDLSVGLAGTDVFLDIENGNTVQFSVDDGDSNPTGELQNLSLALFGDSEIILSIENGNDVQFSINDNDSNPLNELQKLNVNSTVDGFDIQIEGGGGLAEPVVFVEAPFHPEKNIQLLNGGTPTVFIGDNASGGGQIDTRDPGGSQNTFIGTSPFSPGGLVSVVNGGTAVVGMHLDPISGLGVVFADTKHFRIDHPERPNKEIWYASLEGPEAGAYERGTATLVNGEAFVPFSEHFQIVINEAGMTVMLTPLSGESQGLAVIEKTNGGFRVKELHNGNGNYSFDWEVKGVRSGHENYKVIRDASFILPKIQSQN